MGLIKRSHITERGEISLEESSFEAPSIHLESPHRPTRSPAEFTAEERALLGPVRDEAERILAEAREKGFEIIQQAEGESTQIREEARRQGHADGAKEAERELAARSEEVLAVLNDAIKERKKIIRDSEAEILRIALKAAEQIIKSEVSLHRDVCLNIISEAISRVGDREQVIVRVSREDLENVKRYKDRIATLVDGVKSLSILEDTSVDPGGAIIETNLGFVDARISTKLGVLEHALKKVQGGEEGNG